MATKSEYENIFSIDGKTYNVRIPQGGIKRSCSILDSDETERKQDGSLYRDIIGNYFNYTISVDTSLLDHDSYDELHEIVCKPVTSHSITVPYGQSTITYDAYISGVEDTLLKREGGKNFWNGMSLQFVAIDPFEKA